jgi:oligogalacturonide lyase
MAALWTRRGFLFSAAAVAQRGRRLPSERVRLVDPSTEFPLFRLTDPEHASYLPSCCLRAVSKRRTFVLFTSHRTGSPQPFRASLATGEVEQVATARDLDSATLGLLPDDRSCCWFDGADLVHLELRGGRARQVYRIPAGWVRAGEMALSADGASALFAERGATASRIRRVRLRDGAPETVFEAAGPVRDPIPRPGSEQTAYRREQDGGLWLAPGGTPLMEGRLGPAFWSQDGTSLMYLSLPARPGGRAAIRELEIGTGAVRDLAPSTGFACWSPNPNASVFAGANASKASPYVVLMLRVNRKELAICEHRASDAARVSPVFSPDSQALFFQSDREGGPAVYYVPLERIIEVTS